MFKNKSGKVAIVVLGGAIKKTKNGWRTTNFDEKGDNFGVCGDRLRILATSVIYNLLNNCDEDLFIIVSGGKGQYLNFTKNSPFLSKIIKKELVEIGIPSDLIIEDRNSNNTYKQLRESAKILKKRKIRNVLIVSNRYHLPRIKSFIESDIELKKIFSKKYSLESAEDILIASDPKKWKSYISKVYNSKDMKKRVSFENEGIKQIKSGNYDFNIGSKKIRTAMIGLGKIAWAYENDPFVMKRMDFPTHFSVLRKHPGFQLVAVQDSNVVARKSFSVVAKKFQERPNIYKNWKEMIKKESIDLLVVASNTESHIEICNKAIDLGIKAILCEKPLSYHAKEVETLINKAKENKCVLFVNYFRAFNPSYIELIEKIKKGFLGRIQSFDAKYSKGIFNNGTHLVDVLVRMFGEVKSVRGFKNFTCSVLLEDPTISAVLQFKNGVGGYMHGLNNDFYNIFELDILGERGRIKIVNDKTELYRCYKSSIVKGYGSLQIEPGLNLTSIKSGLYPVYDNINQLFINKEKNKCSGEEALVSAKIADKLIHQLVKIKK